MSTTILDAAEQVFGEQGLDARMEAIATRAGVAVGTLYNHFEDRQALVDALRASRRQQLLARLQASLAASQGQPLAQRLEAVLAQAVAVAAARSRFSTMMLQADDVGSHLARQKELAAQFSAVLEDAFARARRDGELAADPKRLQPMMLFGLLKVCLALSSRDPARLPPKDVPRQVVAAFLHGAAPRPGRGPHR